MTLVENVALPLRKHRRLGERAAEAEALRYLELVHIGAFARSYPAELGDGMRKRAAIARALTRRSRSTCSSTSRPPASTR